MSPIEFDILIFMINPTNKILHYEEIYKHVWHNESLGDTRTVMVHVSNLRKKLEDQTDEKYIKTTKKEVYVFLNSHSLQQGKLTFTLNKKPTLNF